MSCFPNALSYDSLNQLLRSRVSCGKTHGEKFGTWQGQININLIINIKNINAYVLLIRYE